VWNAVYGPTTAGRAAHAARPSIPSCAKTLITRAAAQAKCAKINGDYSCTEASVIAFLRHEMFSGGSVPKFEKSKGKKPTSANHTAATSSSKASAVDLVDEDDDRLDKHATTDGHVREAVHASVAFTAAQPVEIDATAAEAAAAPPLRKPLLPHTTLPPKPLARPRKKMICPKSPAVVRTPRAVQRSLRCRCLKWGTGSASSP